MIRVRQLEPKDGLAATSLWASAMKGSNYDESMQKRINEFVESKSNDPNDMGDVFLNYVKHEEKSNNVTSINMEEGINLETNHNNKSRESLPSRNFWVVECINDSQHQDSQGKIVNEWQYFLTGTIMLVGMRRGNETFFYIVLK